MARPAEIPSYEQVRKESGLPEVVDLEDIVGKTIDVLDWAPATRRLPDTGKETEGFEMIFSDGSSDVDKMCFVGAVVLVKELKALRPPFRTVIRKENRTYKFS